MKKLEQGYLDVIADRAKRSRAHTPHQLAGLEAAVLLRDLAHRSLYIKLAKEHGGDRVLELAKRVVEKRGVSNRGAYFMRIASEELARPKRRST